MKLKKIGAALAAAAVSLALLTGCKNVEGKWHCVRFTKDGDTVVNSIVTEEYGYGLSLYAQAEFTNDGKGTLSFENGSDIVSFDWKKDGDKYDLDFKKYNGSAAFEEDRLVITFKEDLGHEYVISFEEGESTEKVNSDVASHSKTALKAANSNAKLVYTAIFRCCSDLINDGKLSEIKAGQRKNVAVADLKEEDAIQKAIKQALKASGIDEGYVSWSVDNNLLQPAWAQWSVSDGAGIVGQYPDPESDPKTEHYSGEKF